jgi:DNA-binding NarL/FixJ family response regulator
MTARPSGTLPDDFWERFRLARAESDVLFDLAEGLNNARIAERRSVTVATVRTHVGRILSKMGVDSRLQAGLRARAAM